MLKTLGVFCAARMGNTIEHVSAVQTMAEQLVKNDIQVVYGGSRMGLMGVLADRIIELGGNVIGIIPCSLENIHEFPHASLTEMHRVDSMSQRKEFIRVKCDGFIMLPGGIGTLDEFFEMMCDVQIGIHNKPCGIFNADGYYDLLIEFLDHATDSGLIDRKNRDAILIDALAEKLIEKFKHVL